MLIDHINNIYTNITNIEGSEKFKSEVSDLLSSLTIDLNSFEFNGKIRQILRDTSYSINIELFNIVNNYIKAYVRGDNNGSK